jgi:hypothetical protein
MGISAAGIPQLSLLKFCLAVSFRADADFYGPRNIAAAAAAQAQPGQAVVEGDHAVHPQYAELVSILQKPDSLKQSLQ